MSQITASRPRASSLALALALLALPAQGLAKSKPAPAKALETALRIDRELVRAMQLRDRGQLDGALTATIELVRANPNNLPAHLLYQEMAAVIRRNGALVEAEYRAHLEASPDDPVRMVLHASATLTAALTTPGYLNRERIKGIERALAAAEVSESAASYAHLVYAEVEQVRERSDEVRIRLERAVAADPNNFTARAELVSAYALTQDTSKAAASCVDLLALTPWRAPQCRGALPGPASKKPPSAEEQALVEGALAAAEAKHANDLVVLEALYGLYEARENRAASKRLESRLTQEPGWSAPLRRNPYLAPLPGGELSEREVASLEHIQTTIEANELPAQRALALKGLEAEIAVESERLQAIYWRLRSHALRDPGVDDKDGSRKAIRRATELQPVDSQMLNEWAYMSALDRVDLAAALEASDRALTMLLGVPFSLVQIEPGLSYADHLRDVGESAGAYLDTRGWLLYQLGRHEEAVVALTIATALTPDGTVQAHLGRARYALGQDEAAFLHLLRGLALGCEEEPEVRKLAGHLYLRSHVVAAGLDALVAGMREQIQAELDAAPAAFDGAPAPTDSNAAPSPVPILGQDSGHALIGRPAPNLVVERLGGRGPLELDELEGRIVVLDFWATWCGPCKEALPAYDALSRAFEGQDVAFVLASVDDSMGAVEGYWAKRDMPAEVGVVQGAGADLFGVRSIPSLFVIDKDGTVLGQHDGFEPSLRDELAATVAWLLSR